MKNPKTIWGLVALAVLVTGIGIMAARLAPVVEETRLEMSLTPTPVPAWPGSVMQVTPDPDAPTPEPVLRTGSAGQEVKDLQSRLAALGYYTAEVDGKYGSATKEAVTLFQQANGLEADGIVGGGTREILFSAGAKPFAAESTDNTGTE